MSELDFATHHWPRVRQARGLFLTSTFSAAFDENCGLNTFKSVSIDTSLELSEELNEYSRESECGKQTLNDDCITEVRCRRAKRIDDAQFLESINRCDIGVVLDRDTA